MASCSSFPCAGAFGMKGISVGLVEGRSCAGEFEMKSEELRIREKKSTKYRVRSGDKR